MRPVNAHAQAFPASRSGLPSRIDDKSAYNRGMYIIAMGWLYVTALMSLAETGFVAGVLTFVFYGLLPVALLLWLFGGSMRRRRGVAPADDPKTDGMTGTFPEASPESDNCGERKNIP